MIITNALLSIGIGVVSNFCELVHIPIVYAPKSINDVQSYVVGAPSSPIDLFLTGPMGVRFGVRDGSVYYFCSPGSLSHEQDPSKLAQYTGEALLSSNQVVQVVSNTLVRLMKVKIPLSGVPRLREEGPYHGKPMPFVYVEWPNITPRNHVNAADVEVDERSGRIVFVHLLDDVFFDYDLGERIRRQVTGVQGDERK
jgi:hypothetical protein